MVSEVNPSKDKCALKLRVVRLYEKPVYGNSDEKTFEIVFHDKEVCYVGFCFDVLSFILHNEAAV